MIGEIMYRIYIKKYYQGKSFHTIDDRSEINQV